MSEPTWITTSEPIWVTLRRIADDLEATALRAPINDAADLEMLRNSIPIASAWKHQKGPVYVAQGYCRLERTAQPAILYYNRWADDPTIQIPWARDAKEFQEKFSRVMVTGDRGAIPWPEDTNEV